MKPSDAGGIYSKSVGTISVTAKVPADWRGEGDGFNLRNIGCLFDASIGLGVAVIRAVPSDACHWRLTTAAATTPAAVTAALAAQAGHETIGPTDATVGGYPASRFEFTPLAKLDLETCDGDDGLRLAAGGSEDEVFGGPEPDEHVTLYVVDVEGLAIGVGQRVVPENASPAHIAELAAIVTSLRFEP